MAYKPDITAISQLLYILNKKNVVILREIVIINKEVIYGGGRHEQKCRRIAKDS